MRQLIEVYDFAGYCTFTLGFVNHDLIMRTTHLFHVIDSPTAFHLMLRRPWIHRHKVIPSTYHQYLKAIWKESREHINATKSQFQRDEGHFSELVYFDELAEDGEVAPARPSNVPLQV